MNNLPLDKPKRFVAGAKCIHCQKIDTTVIYTQEQKRHITCIACGYTQSQDDLEIPTAETSLKDTLLSRLKRQKKEED